MQRSLSRWHRENLSWVKIDAAGQHDPQPTVPGITGAAEQPAANQTFNSRRRS